MRAASLRSSLELFRFLPAGLILLLTAGTAAGQRAIQFAGSGNYLEVAADTALASPEFTYEYWLQVQALGDPEEASGEQTVLDKRGGSGGYNARLAGTEWPISFYSFHGEGESDWLGYFQVNPMDWVHYAVTQASDSARLYVNGVLVDVRDAHYSPDFGSSLRIGELQAYPGYSLPLFGAMDELRVWDHARPADSIRAHVHSPVSPVAEGLALYYDFETFDGDTLRDRSPRGNDATVVGLPELVDSGAPWNFVPPPTAHGLRSFGDNDQVNLVWSSYAADLDRFYIFRSDSADFEADDGHLVAVVRTPDTTYVDDLVEQGHVYYYQIRVGDAMGHRGPSSHVSAARVGAAPETYLTGVHYDGVFGPTDGGREWQEGYFRAYTRPSQPPLLGEYSNRDPQIIQQHLAWMEEYGIDFMVTSWWTHWNWSALTVKDYVLDELRDSSVKIAALIRMGRYGLNEPFDDADRDTLLADFTYLADELFSHPNYLQIDGRYVVFLNAIQAMYGDFEPAFLTLRDSMSSRGYDLFLIGDDVRFGAPHAEHMTVLDGIMQYLPADLTVHAGYAVEQDLIADVSRTAGDWSRLAAENGVLFVPAVLPGYNASYGTSQSPVIPRQIQPGAGSTSLLDESIRAMRPFADPGVGMILINSFNRWNFDTQIEPTIETDPTSLDSSPEGDFYTRGFTFEGYGMKPLELVRELLAPELLVGFKEEIPRRVAPLGVSCYPNPFGTLLNVSVDLASTRGVVVDIYDVLGRRLATVSRVSALGSKAEFQWHAEGIAPGLYFVRVRSGLETSTEAVIKGP